MKFKIEDQSTKWRIGSRIGKEKDHKSEMNLSPPFDSTAVFNCTQEDVDEEPVSAILKIWMQYVIVSIVRILLTLFSGYLIVVASKERLNLYRRLLNTSKPRSKLYAA